MLKEKNVRYGIGAEAGTPSMKAYLLMTGGIFALITLVHIGRMVVEPHVAARPWFLALTVLSAALAVWAWRLLRSSPRGAE